MESPQIPRRSNARENQKRPQEVGPKEAPQNLYSPSGQRYIDERQDRRDKKDNARGLADNRNREKGRNETEGDGKQKEAEERKEDKANNLDIQIARDDFDNIGPQSKAIDQLQATVVPVPINDKIHQG